MALTLVGAGIAIGESVIGLVARFFARPTAVEPTPRHNVGKVHEQVQAAQRAAHAAGVLRPRR